MKNMFKKHGAMLILCLIFFGGIAVFFTAFYTNVKTETLKVMGIPAPRVSVSGSDGDTYSSCEYFVATDKGMYKIEPDGFFHSDAFGMLEMGHTYTVQVRGFTNNFLGIYPYITKLYYEY
jgi:hypothetical protein